MYPERIHDVNRCNSDNFPGSNAGNICPQHIALNSIKRHTSPSYTIAHRVCQSRTRVIELRRCTRRERACIARYALVGFFTALPRIDLHRECTKNTDALAPPQARARATSPRTPRVLDDSERRAIDRAGNYLYVRCTPTHRRC